MSVVAESLAFFRRQSARKIQIWLAHIVAAALLLTASFPEQHPRTADGGAGVGNVPSATRASFSPGPLAKCDETGHLWQLAQGTARQGYQAPASMTATRAPRSLALSAADGRTRIAIKGRETPSPFCLLI